MGGATGKSIMVAVVLILLAIAMGTAVTSMALNLRYLNYYSEAVVNDMKREDDPLNILTEDLIQAPLLYKATQIYYSNTFNIYLPDGTLLEQEYYDQLKTKYAFLFFDIVLSKDKDKRNRDVFNCYGTRDTHAKHRTDAKDHSVEGHDVGDPSDEGGGEE